MSSINSLEKQKKLERFLSPKRNECSSCLYFGKKFIVIHFYRLYWFLKDLFCSHKFKYRNDRWVSYKVTKNPVSNEFTEKLIQKLRVRHVTVLTPEVMLQEIETCPRIKALFTEAKETIQKVENKNLRLRFVGKRQIPFNADCDCFNGEIRIHANLNKNMALSIFVFELLNAKKVEKFKEIHEQSLTGQIENAKEFAIRNEKIEFENIQTHIQLVESAIKENGWSSSTKIYKGWKSFEDYLKTQKRTGHFQYYVNHFNKIKKWQADSMP